MAIPASSHWPFPPSSIGLYRGARGCLVPRRHTGSHLVKNSTALSPSPFSAQLCQPHPVIPFVTCPCALPCYCNSSVQCQNSTSSSHQFFELHRRPCQHAVVNLHSTPFASCLSAKILFDSRAQNCFPRAFAHISLSPSAFTGLRSLPARSRADCGEGGLLRRK